MRNYTVIVKDENGITYMEGLVSSMQISGLVHTPGTKLQLEAYINFGPGKPAVKSYVPQPGDSTIPTGTIANNSITAAKCTHKWKSYQGLQEKYDYCEICGVKK